jgi:uncharacterized coiled-coil protein SlyX
MTNEPGVKPHGSARTAELEERVAELEKLLDDLRVMLHARGVVPLA